MSMYRVKIKVKELSEERDWSLSELSRRSGVPYNTVRRYAMQPMAKIEIDPVSRIKERFGCSWNELLELVGDDPFDE